MTAAAGCAGGGPTGSAPAPGCDPAAPEPGFRSLFDGTEASLREWRQAGPGGFRLEDCALHSTGGMGLLWHPEPLGDVELRVDWRAEGDDNSGVFVGFPDPDDDPWVAVTGGREVQIDGSDVAARSTAAVYDVTAPDEAARDAALRPPGEWNTFAVTVAEGQVVVRLNGMVVTEHRETDPERLAVPAHVGLQNHSEVDRVSFRRVRVRDIDDEEG